MWILTKYNQFYNFIKTNSSKSSLNVINYFNYIYNTKYLFQNKLNCFYKQNYNLHIKLFSDLHKNIISLPKILNYNFNSYCLSDYSLKTKYLAPKILLANLKTIALFLSST